MKYLNLLILTAILLFAGCKDKSKQKLVMATNAEFPPYEYISGTKIDGIDPEIIRRIAEKLGYELDIQNMSFVHSEGLYTPLNR